MTFKGLRAAQARMLAALVLLTGLLLPQAEAGAAVACKSPPAANSKACGHKPPSKPASHHKAKPITAKAAVRSVAAPDAAPDPAAPSSPCFVALASSQASQRMAAKLPFIAGLMPGPAALANAQHPSRKEQSELSSLIAGYQMCHDMPGAAPTGGETAQAAGPDAAHWNAIKSILDNLQAGKLSYGAATQALAQAGQQRQQEPN